MEIGPNAGRGSTEDAYRTRGESGARTEAQRLAEAGKAEAKAVWDETKASVRSVLHEKQHSTAADIGEFAGALRAAARNLDRQTPVSRIAGHTADSLERLSGTLRDKDIESLMHEVQTFARNQPAVFLGMAVAAGFLFTRFLGSSAQRAAVGEERASPPGTPGSGDSAATAGAEAESHFPYDPRRT